MNNQIHASKRKGNLSPDYAIMRYCSMIQKPRVIHVCYKIWRTYVNGKTNFLDVLKIIRRVFLRKKPTGSEIRGNNKRINDKKR